MVVVQLSRRCSSTQHPLSMKGQGAWKRGGGRHGCGCGDRGDQRVGVATSLAAWGAHWDAGRSAAGTGRSWLPGDAELRREQVLAALSAAAATLLEALEVSAVPDDEWRAGEARAIETMQVTKGSVPAYAVDVNAGKDVPWIEQHAAYHARRLPNGGVMLSTHPYRTLWQLYEGALFLLGIDPA